MSQLLSQTRERLRLFVSAIRGVTAVRWWYKAGFTSLSICVLAGANFGRVSEAKGAIRQYIAHRRFGFTPSSSDTAYVFGPKQFLTVKSNTQVNYVESFTGPQAAPPGTAQSTGQSSTQDSLPPMQTAAFHTMVIRRVGGSLTTANVSLNGTQVAVAADFASVTSIERVVLVNTLANNTLSVSLKGALGAGLVVTIFDASSFAFDVFGPTFYQKTATTPTHFVESFPLPPEASLPYRITASPSASGTKATITLNGVQVIKDVDFTGTGPVSRDANLVGGNNSMVIDVRGNTGTQIVVEVTANDQTPPVLTITSPVPNLVTNANTLAVMGTSQDRSPTQVNVNGVAAIMSGTRNTQFSASVPLTEGINAIAIQATDQVGNHTDSTRSVRLDTQTPTLTVTGPVDNSYTNQDAVTVAGTVSDASAVTVKVNGVSLPVGQSGVFSGSYTLAAGVNFLTVTATDAGGNVTSVVRKVTQAKQPPVLTVATPSDGFAKNTTPLAVSGTVTGTTPIAVSANGVALVVSGSSFSGNVPLTEGANDIAITATDPAGNTTVVHRVGKLDTHAPVLTLTSPTDASFSNATTATVSGTVTDESSFTVAVNGTPVTVAGNGSFTQTVTLAAGANAITVTATDAATNATTLQRTVTQDRTPPTLTVATPTDGIYTNATAVNVTGSATDQTPVSVKVNGSSVTLNPDGSFAYSLTLVAGTNTVTVVATDGAANATTVSRSVTQDRVPPSLWVDIQGDDFFTTADALLLTISATDASPITVTVNGSPVQVDANGKYPISVPLALGLNETVVRVTDAAGNAYWETEPLFRDIEAPVIALNSPQDGAHFDTEPISIDGTLTDNSGAKVFLTLNGDHVELDPDDDPSNPAFPSRHFSTQLHLVAGSNTISLVATDPAGNTSSLTRTVVLGAVETLPPDPATVAPKLDATVATTTFAATSFLYTGANPIQTGVVAGTIQPLQAAVIRGSVRAQTGAALTAVTVSVLHHPEFGQTLSRADGAFDLVVNGGDPVTIGYQKTGFLPAQRTVSPLWQDYTSIDSVTLVALDPAVTTVDFSQPTQVAQGTQITDASGTRQATVLFKSGTHAALKFADGSTQPLNSIAVRATEYTVGPTGPSAMPAELPPTTAYTYAVELSVDTAIAAGAKSVVFDQPVAFYVDNFLNFPTGKPVPVGYYDRESAQWVASPNGRIIKVLQVVNGRASIDVDGSGTEATPEALTALGMNEAELTRLGTLYASGRSLWRVSLTHFSTFDLNYGRNVDTTSVPPTNPNPVKRKAPDKDCHQSGSIIGCERQTLGESLPIAGTSLSLNYQSDRVPGYKEAYSADISLIGNTVPLNLTRIELEVRVAGKVSRQSYSNQPNQTAHFVWDGKDPYGRPIQGSQLARVRIGYVYPSRYADVFFWSLVGDFGNYAGDALTQDPARSEATLWQEITLSLGTHNRSAEGLGGWGIDVHHYYDPMGQVLYLGDGSRRTGSALSNSTTTIAGTVCTANCANTAKAGDRAVDDFIGTEGIALAKDGTMYITDDHTNKIWHVNTSGILELVAGNGTTQPNGDGIAATGAGILPSGDVKVAPDNSVYFTDFAVGQRIRRIDNNGVITTVAGTGVCGSSVADGALAIQADLCFIDFAVAKDGALFLESQTEVYRVGADGILKRVVGDGTFARCPNTTASFVCAEGKRANAHGVFHQLRGIAVAADGTLYVANREFRVANGMVIYRIGTDGIIHRIAGNGNSSGPLVDGFLATTSAIQSHHSELGVGADGTLYYTEDAGWVYRVDEKGILRIIAGCVSSPGPATCNGNSGGRAKLTTLQQPRALDFGPDGRLYILDRIARRIDAPLPGLGINTVTVASEDGSELYLFDADGRHLRTMEATGASTIFSFAYNASGLLASVTDGDGNTTSVERDGAGLPVAIVAPFGQRTTLTTDAQHFLSSVQAPGQPATSVVNAVDGLLSTITDLHGTQHQFIYDGSGLLTRDDNGSGGFTTLARTKTDSSSSVTLTSAMGITAVHSTTTRSTGGSRRVSINSAGLATTVVEDPNGTVTTASPDSMVTTVAQGSDPRFGMQSTVLNRITTRTPAGVVSTTSGGRRTVLSNPADPTTLVTQVDSSIVNGRIFRSTYIAATRTLTALTPVGRTSTEQFDALGRVIAKASPGITPLQYQYDSRGRLAQATRGTRQWIYSYDALGRLSTTTDPLTHSSQSFYDSGDRLTRRLLQDGREVLYGYDTSGSLRSVTPPGRPAHQFQYDGAGLLTAYTPPSLGAGAWNTTFQYDADSRLTQVTKPDAQIITFGFDQAGRQSAVTVPGGIIQYSYNAVKGTASGATGPYGGSLAFSYDGSLLTGVTWAGEVAGSLIATYNTDYKVSGLAVNGGAPIAFTYDSDGQLTQAGELTITRDPTNAQLTGTTFGPVTTALSYSSLGELAGQTASINGAPLFDVTYHRDSLGRIADLTESIEGLTTSKAYTYDLAGRLSEVRRDGVLTGVYEYDANSNRARVTRPSGVETGTYDDQDRLLTYGSSSFTYGRNGDLSRKASSNDTTRYEYDVLGNLRRVTLPDGSLIEYVVDASNRRIGKKVNGVLLKGWLYQDRFNPIVELDGVGNIVSRFVYGSAGNVPDYIVKNGTTYRIITDNLGSVRLVVNGITGAIVQRLDYDEFGRILANTNPGFQPFGFAGGLYDEQTQLVRFGPRDYDPETGRWASKDPMSFGGGDVNLYSYGFEDPVNTVDRSGRFGVPVIAIGIALIAGGVNGVMDVLNAISSDCERNEPLWKTFRNGLVAGAAGAVAGEIVFAAGARDPYVIGGLASSVTAGVEAFLGADVSLTDAVVQTVAGAAAGGLARKAVRMPGREPSPWKLRPLKDALNPNSIRVGGREALGDAAGGGASMGSSRALGLLNPCPCGTGH